MILLGLWSIMSICIFKNKNVSMKLFALPKHLIDNKSKGGEKLDFGKEKTRSH